MGITGDFLVFITSKQHDLINKEKFNRAIEFFLDYSVWKLSTYIYFNNGFDIIARHAKKLESEYPLVAEFLRKSAIQDYKIDESLSLEDAMKELSKKHLPVWVMPDAEELLSDLLDRSDKPVILADKVLYFQYETGNIFYEDMEEERDYAERTLSRLFDE